MSAKEVKLKINQLSKNIAEILEKESDEDKKIKIFENFYTTLNLIQDMYSLQTYKNPRKKHLKLTF